MDRIDRKILDVLQADASIRNVELADRVGLAPSSCLRRVRRLWETGVIKRSVVLTDGEKMGRNLRAVVSVKLADHRSTSQKEWMAKLKREPAVAQVYSVSGETDTIIIFNLTSMQNFQDLSQTLLDGEPNVIQYLTNFVLEEHKFETAL